MLHQSKINTTFRLPKILDDPREGTHARIMAYTFALETEKLHYVSILSVPRKLFFTIFNVAAFDVYL